MNVCQLVLNAHSRLLVILDCTEIHVQKPSSKVLNSAIYSHYKGNSTMKGLMALPPRVKRLLSVTYIQVQYLTKKLPKKQVSFL